MLEWINANIFGIAVPVFLMLLGVILVFRLKAFWLRRPKKLFSAIFGGGGSSLRALSLALAGTLGVGNIVGVAAAVVLGGAGAIFWMWVSAIAAMVIKYAEIVLAMRYRSTDVVGRVHGGAMYYIKESFRRIGLVRLGGALAMIFSMFCIFNCFSMGTMLQCEAVSGAVEGCFGGGGMIATVCLTLLTFFTVKKGSQGIMKVTEALVPVMTVGYVVLSFWAIFLKREYLPAILGDIIGGALEPFAASAGIVGFLFSRGVRFGVMRGLISNEAGCGTAPLAHALSDNPEPAAQGVLGMVEVFVDTVVLCTLTAFTVLLSRSYMKCDGNNFIGVAIDAYSSILGEWAGVFMCVAMVLFAFGTVICWAHYGKESLDYLMTRTGLSGRISEKRLSAFFVVVFSVFVFLGGAVEAGIIWQLSDLATGGMTLINLTAICLGRGEVERETEKYFDI